MMKKVLLAGLLMLALFGLVLADEGQDGEDKQGDDDKKCEEEDKWGEYKLDWPLNVPWSYPSDYVSRPLNYSREVFALGIDFKYLYSDQYWDDEGKLIDAPFQIAKQTIGFYLGVGFTDVLTLEAYFPFTYKKTRVLKSSNNYNYRENDTNVYGTLFEEELYDYLDGGEGWDWWNFQLPLVGDFEFKMTYSLYRKLEPTTSAAIQSFVKFPTGNDNPRAGKDIRNYITSGNTDWYNGLGFKQQFWKFDVALAGGYLWRMPSNTKYGYGTVDLADQLKAYGEFFFQMPQVKPFFKSFAIGVCADYYLRLVNTEIDPVRGDKRELDDGGGYLLTISPKLVYQKGSKDIWASINIPFSGQSSLLGVTHNFFYPPYDIESYEPTGVSYAIGFVKRYGL